MTPIERLKAKVIELATRNKALRSEICDLDLCGRGQPSWMLARAKFCAELSENQAKLRKLRRKIRSEIAKEQREIEREFEEQQRAREQAFRHQPLSMPRGREANLAYYDIDEFGNVLHQRQPGQVVPICGETELPLPVVQMPRHVGDFHFLGAEIDRRERSYIQRYSALSKPRSRRYDDCGA